MVYVPMLADLTEAERNKLIFWLAVLLVVVIAGFVVIMLLRKYIQEPAGGQSQDAGFSLSELRALRDRGEISPEEYENARTRVIAAAKKMLDKKPPAPDRLKGPAPGIEPAPDPSASMPEPNPPPPAPPESPPAA